MVTWIIFFVLKPMTTLGLIYPTHFPMSLQFPLEDAVKDNPTMQITLQTHKIAKPLHVWNFVTNKI